MASLADDPCLQPDILARETLISTLKLRQIKENELDSMDKCDLVQLYKAHVVPMPQRFGHDSRRWQRIHAKLMANVDGRALIEQKSSNKINGFCVKPNGEMPADLKERLRPAQTTQDLHGKVNLIRKRSRPDLDTSTVDKITSVLPTTTDRSPAKKSKAMNTEPSMTKSKHLPITWP